VETFQITFQICSLHFSADYTSCDEIALGVPPFCHAYGLLLVLMCMCEGTRVVVVRKFKPDLFIQSIEEHKVCLKYIFTHFCGKRKRLCRFLNCRSLKLHSFTRTSYINNKNNRHTHYNFSGAQGHHCYTFPELHMHTTDLLIISTDTSYMSVFLNQWSTAGQWLN
jgi:hypothetical protein